MRLWPTRQPPPDLDALARTAASEAVAAYRAEQEQARVQMAAKVEEVKTELSRAQQTGMLGITPAAPGANGRSRRPFARDNPWQYAVPHAPTYHPGQLVDVRTLRRFVQVFDPARSMINHLKREVEAAPFAIVARDAKDDSPAIRAKIKEAEAWFSRDGGLGGRGFTRSRFEKEIIEELMVIGPAAIYLEPTRGGGLYEAVCIDASTIRPVVDPYGFPDPKRAYEQWIMGIPGRSFSMEEMYWEGLYPRTDSPYPDAPTEYLILSIVAGMALDTWNRTFFTTGTEPRRFLGFPPEFTVEQVMEWLDLFTALYEGNLEARNKLVPFPAGANQIEPPSRRDQDFQEYELQVIRRCGAVYGVQPSSVGLSAGREYAVTQEKSNDQTSEIGTALLLLWFENAYNYFLERLGYDDLEAKYRTQREESPAEKADRILKLTGVPIWSINRGLQELGDDPLPDDQGNVLFVPTTYQPIDLALNPPEPMPPTAPGAESSGDAGAQRIQRADESGGRWVTIHGHAIHIDDEGHGTSAGKSHHAASISAAHAKAKKAGLDERQMQVVHNWAERQSNGDLDTYAEKLHTAIDAHIKIQKENEAKYAKEKAAREKAAAKKTATDAAAQEKATLETKVPYGVGEGKGEVGIPAIEFRKRPHLCRKLRGVLHLTEHPTRMLWQHEVMSTFAKMPSSLVEHIGKSGGKVFVGLEELSALNDGEKFKTLKTTYASHAGQVYDQFAAGVYNPRTGCALVGKNADRNIPEVMLHEIGHHIGETTNLDHEPETYANYVRLHDRLTPYEKQEGPGSNNGRKEFVAETFATYFEKGREAAVARYDKEWVGHFEEHLIKSGVIKEPMP